MKPINLLPLAALLGSSVAAVIKRDEFAQGQPIDYASGKGAPITGMRAACSGEQLSNFESQEALIEHSIYRIPMAWVSSLPMQAPCPTSSGASHSPRPRSSQEVGPAPRSLKTFHRTMTSLARSSI